MRRPFRTLALALLLSPWVFHPSSAFAAKNLKIRSFQYDQHFHPGDIVRFTLQITNNEPTTEFAEVDITTSNLDTEQELTLTPVMTTSIPPRETVYVTADYRFSAGIYTVSFPLFDGNGERSDRVAGKFPIHVGTETETLRVFPEVLNLGTLPPGRYMHPTPIEVTWNYFRFNQLRLDQPFAIRIYTDNAARYHGIPNALRVGSPAGLVSLDGKYTVPIKVWTLNFGPDIQETGWDSPLAGPPPVDDDDYWIGPPLLEGARSEGSANWVRLPDLTEMTTNPITWRRLLGQDPHDDRFVGDANPTGDFTLRSPFTFYLATEGGPATVAGSYSTTLIVELWTP